MNIRLVITPPKPSVAEVRAELAERLNPALRTKVIPRNQFGGPHVMLDIVPKMKCRNGLEMSVQASETHYCSPRDNTGPWYAVEVGFPNRVVEGLRPHQDGDGDMTDSVFGYVPIGTVAEIIANAGGFAP